MERARFSRRSSLLVLSGLASAAVMVASVLVAGDDPTGLEKSLRQASGKEWVEVLLRLAKVNMYRAPDEVISFAQQALDAAAALSLPRDSARALLARATGYFQLGDLEHALESYQQGLTAGERLSDHLIIGGCLNGVAAVNMKRGQLDAAVDFLGRAIEELKLAPGNTKLADPTHARANFEQALLNAEKTGNEQLMVGCLVNIGEVHSKKHEWDLALGYLNRALPIARELGSRDFISVCLNNIGDVLREKGESAGALRYYLESLKIFDEMNARPRQAVSYQNIGRLYLKTGDLPQAERFLLRAFELARGVEERSLQHDATEALCEVYEKQGNFRRAFEFQPAQSDLKEQIFSRENYEKIATLKATCESEKQSREFELLRKQREIPDFQVKR